jgi:hypothetical protein
VPVPNPPSVAGLLRATPETWQGAVLDNIAERARRIAIWAPAYEHFAQQLAQLMPRRRKDIREGARRTCTGAPRMHSMMHLSLVRCTPIFCRPCTRGAIGSPVPTPGSCNAARAVRGSRSTSPIGSPTSKLRDAPAAAVTPPLPSARRLFWRLHAIGWRPGQAVPPVRRPAATTSSEVPSPEAR